MDFEAYKKNYYTDPPPEPRFAFTGIRGASIFVEDYPAALAFYKKVFGPPNYVEGESTHGWRFGETWFTLFPSKKGGPANSDISLEMASPAEADKLRAALVEAGAKGGEPVDTIMYVPIRYCGVTDPFGTEWVIYSPLSGGTQ